MALFLLSLMGIPPLVGFMGKLYVFAAVIERGYIWYAVVGAVNAAIAAFYYARIMKTMIIDAGNEDKPAFRLPAADLGWVWLFVLGNVVPLLVWQRIETWAKESLVLWAGR
jgi:NADH-quinone oxidoreductase subunit N